MMISSFVIYIHESTSFSISSNIKRDNTTPSGMKKTFSLLVLLISTIHHAVTRGEKIKKAQKSEI